MKRRILLFLTLTLGAPLLTTAAAPPRTRVAIVKDRWHLNGAVTDRGSQAEGW